MFEQINEPVKCISEIGEQGGKLVPLEFVWKNRTTVVKGVNLSYSVWEGRNKIFYFAVSDSINYFKLRFDSTNLKWTLLETYVD